MVKKPRAGNTKVKKLKSGTVCKPSYKFIVRCINRGISRENCTKVSLTLCKVRSPEHDQAVIQKVKESYRIANSTCNVIQKNPDFWRKTRYRDEPDFWRIAKIAEPYDEIKMFNFKKLLEAMWIRGFKPTIQVGATI